MGAFQFGGEIKRKRAWQQLPSGSGWKFLPTAGESGEFLPIHTSGGQICLNLHPRTEMHPCGWVHVSSGVNYRPGARSGRSDD